MGSKTGIQWTQATWNPLRGCSKESEGCRYCYAMGIAARFSGEGQPYEGLAGFNRVGDPYWTGEVRLVESHVEDPLRWKKPKMIFVNSMSDWAHEDVPDEWVDRILHVAERAHWHTFQFLTKRSSKMRYHLWRRYGRYGWTAPRHMWFGVSVEDQRTANIRIEELLESAARVLFLSCEPLLGPLSIKKWLPTLHSDGTPLFSYHNGFKRAIDWVIIGGESGPHARPMELSWAEALVEECRGAKVPVFVKQLGEVQAKRLGLKDKKGGLIDEWPAHLRVREFPV